MYDVDVQMDVIEKNDISSLCLGVVQLAGSNETCNNCEFQHENKAKAFIEPVESASDKNFVDDLDADEIEEVVEPKLKIKKRININDSDLIDAELLKEQ